MFSDDFTEILSAEFKSTFIKWFNTKYSKESSESKITPSDADPTGQYFMIEKEEEKKGFDMFTKDIFDLKNPEYKSFKSYLSQSRSPVKYFSLFFDIVINTVIGRNDIEEPILKLDEYYNIMSSNFQNSFIHTYQAPSDESRISAEQIIDTTIEASSSPEQFFDRRLSVNGETFKFISKSVIHNPKLITWINLEFWSDFYFDKNLDDGQMKFSLRKLILIIKMLENRRERYLKMDIKIKN